MQEILYLEVPTPDLASVRQWLQQEWKSPIGQKIPTQTGVRWQIDSMEGELSIFTWSVLRTTYLKVFRWGNSPVSSEKAIIKSLKQGLSYKFPPTYPEPPAIDGKEQSIFEALAPYYPKTVHFFRKFPRGEFDLQRVYWWEKRWRDSVRHPQQPKQVIFEVQESEKIENVNYDLIYVGGALGAIHGAVMARLGYRVLLVERLPFGRMNREWNISRDEFEKLIELGLFTPQEFEELIANEYKDGFNKFFDGNNPDYLKADVLHTPKVLNIALDTSKLLAACGKKLQAAGGEIWDETEFIRADISKEQVKIEFVHLPTEKTQSATGRLLMDAMGTASPIAWQLNGQNTFDSVCPTVGGILEGLDETVWDSQYGDVLNSHGDISRGRQLIWELFPAEGKELTVYLFHYHEVHPDNPGSLLEMYEDFFNILPEYRRCDIEALTWKKATFGYIPGHFSTGKSDRTIAYDRLLAIGDAASLQSPLVFTGFGSLVRNLRRLTHLLDIALKNDLLKAKDLGNIRAYQSNIAVTWLFSKGMMVPTAKMLPPQRVNAMLNTFFGLLADSPSEVADTFIKDRTSWGMFSRLALKAARKNPRLLLWIWEMAGSKDMIKWLGVYAEFTLDAIINALFGFWFPAWLKQSQPWLEKRFPAMWLRLLSFRYYLNVK
ncbi:MAG: NAD(P)/FAD-dependent oxidoreductase [Microcystaceae cyanobacterium]